MDEEGRLLRFNLRATGAAKVDPEAENNSRKLADVQRQVNAICQGKRRDFDFELAAEGPEFDKKVWAALLEIPFGTTTSYGAVAKTHRPPDRGPRGWRGQWRQSHRPDRALPPGDRRRRLASPVMAAACRSSASCWSMRRACAARGWICLASEHRAQ